MVPQKLSSKYSMHLETILNQNFGDCNPAITWLSGTIMHIHVPSDTFFIALKTHSKCHNYPLNIKNKSAMHHFSNLIDWSFSYAF